MIAPSNLTLFLSLSKDVLLDRPSYSDIDKIVYLRGIYQHCQIYRFIYGEHLYREVMKGLL